MIFIVLSFTLAYLLGSIPTSVWVGRMLYGLDVREHGSGNAGATNTLRVLGLKAGIPVLIFDVFKGWLAVFIAKNLLKSYYSGSILEIWLIFAGLFAVIGHVFPVFAGLRGGKGVATLLGMGIALFLWPALASVVVFVVSMIFIRIVSVSSMAAGIAFPFFVIFLPWEPRPGLPLIILSIFVAFFLPFTHRENIRRLIRGEEKKFTIGRTNPKV